MRSFLRFRVAACCLGALACAGGVIAASPSSPADWLSLPALQTHQATHALLTSVVRAGTRLIAVGEHGVILLSDDGGQSWSQTQVPVSVTLTAVSFPTPELGWAVGHDGVVLHTSDGGKTWIKQFDGNQANPLVLAEAQASVEAARAVAGESPAEDSPEATRLADAEFALEDAQAGAEFGPSRALLSVSFVDAKVGYAVGAFGQLFHTADGGQSWQSWGMRLNNPSRYHNNQVTATAEGLVLIAGEGGRVYRSTDAGASFQVLETGYEGPLYGALSLKANSLLAYGFAGHAFRSDDGGANWQSLPTLSRKSLIAGVLLADGTPLLASQDRKLLRGDVAASAFTDVSVPSGGPVVGMTALPDGSAAILSGFGGATRVPLR